MSVGAEGSRRVGADPGGAERAVSLPAGYFPAAILTCHSSLRLHVSTTDRQTDGRLQRGRSRPPEGSSSETVHLSFPGPPHRLLSW